jgi:cytochrome b involved in lipid metabolism
MTRTKHAMPRAAALVAILTAAAVGLAYAPAASAAPVREAPASMVKAVRVAPAAAPALVVIPAVTYTMTDVALHNVAGNCWVVLSNNVYDLTVFLSKHSGGSGAISPACGKDGTSRFTGQHSSLTGSINTKVTGGATTFSTYLNQYMIGALAATPAAPSAPTGLVATPGNGQVSLAWAATTGATSYNVLRGGTQVGTSATNSYTATGLTNSISYSFTVQAVNAGGTSAASAAATATPVAPVVIPSAPTGLVATPGSTQVTLSWTATAGATSYIVLKAGVQAATPSTNSQVVTGLTNGTTYSFTVQAVNSAGASGPSAAATATPVAPASAPSTPTGLNATAGNGQVALTWNATTGATSYQILRVGVVTATAATPAYTATNLVNGTPYSFTVKAVNAVGTSAASSAVSATPVAPPTAPTAPTSLAGTASDSQVALTWVASTGATSYEIYKDAVLAGTSATAAYTAAGLANGTAYSFTVKAVNAVGTSAASSALSVTPSAAVPAGSFAAATVALHATAGNCWVSIAGNVYDLTSFLLTHSGGAGAISPSCGGDATNTFYGKHGSSAGGKLGVLSSFLKGALANYVATALPTQAPTPTVDAVVGGGEYTMEEVKAHGSAGDCWTVIFGGVYGLSTWIPVHPGGSAVVAAMCGIDGSAMYAGKHGNSGSAGDILGKIKLGVLVASKATAATAAAPTYTLADVAKHNTAADCWSIVNGTVYDLTSWITKHPGGAEAITAMCGIDGTAMYNGKHGSSTSALGALDSMKVGDFAGSTGDAATAASPKTATFDAKRVRRHNTATNCWTVIDGNVYNLTAWTKKHADREATIAALCGRNATKYYAKTGGVTKATKELKRYMIGKFGAAAPVSSSAATATTKYTLDDVAKHAAATSCWSVVSGSVYDLTAWIGKHPGGAGVITGMCGVDGTASFNSMHSGSASAKAALAKMKLGVIA